MRHAFAAAVFAGLLAAAPGCVIVQTGVTNPVPGLTTVAVAPFLNLSHERSVDGRRFAFAYQAELQKVPGFQVLPVGVTEQAISDLGLDLDGPDDALALAKELGVDAVVIGAVTDYNPYYPPRIGLQVAWYSPKAWQFVPGVPVQTAAGEPRPLILAQSPDEAAPAQPPLPAPAAESEPARLGPSMGGPSAMPPPVMSAPFAACPPEYGRCGPGCPPAFCPPSFDPAHDPRKPIMAYTRLFDGAEADLTALLRDYVALSGDLRSGGWEAYLHRSEDFIRFTAHRMILEMLTLHGGESKRRYVWMLHRNHD